MVVASIRLLKDVLEGTPPKVVWRVSVKVGNPEDCVTKTVSEEELSATLRVTLEDLIRKGYASEDSCADLLTRFPIPQ